jgi:hypothetical protein
VLMKNTLRLTHHFARDGGLVIDTFLQHEASAPGTGRTGCAGLAVTGYHRRS